MHSRPSWFVSISAKVEHTLLEHFYYPNELAHVELVELGDLYVQ